MNFYPQCRESVKHEVHDCQENNDCERECQSAGCLAAPIDDRVNEVVEVAIRSAEKRVGQAEQIRVEDAKAKRVHEMPEARWVSDNEEINEPD